MVAKTAWDYKKILTLQSCGVVLGNMIGGAILVGCLHWYLHIPRK